MIKLFFFKDKEVITIKVNSYILWVKGEACNLGSAHAGALG